MVRGIGHVLHALHQALVAPGHDEDGQALLNLLEVAEIRLDAAEAEAAAHQEDGRLPLGYGHGVAHRCLGRHLLQRTCHGDARHAERVDGKAMANHAHAHLLGCHVVAVDGRIEPDLVQRVVRHDRRKPVVFLMVAAQE